jgi:hypothetical protein
MNEYIKSLKDGHRMLTILPVLSVELIKKIDNDCVRMYLYCYYNYPEFYNYKKKKLSRYINKRKVNLILFATWCGHLNILKYLIISGLDINHRDTHGDNAYIYAASNFQFRMMKYLETTNINIYQRNHELKNAFDILFRNCQDSQVIYRYIINKIKYTGFVKICSICYECQDIPFIICKNNHIVHLDCQAEKDRYRCLMCSSKYLI